MNIQQQLENVYIIHIELNRKTKTLLILNIVLHRWIIFGRNKLNKKCWFLRKIRHTNDRNMKG